MKKPVLIFIMLLFCGLKAFEQAPATAGPAFDYHRDFRVILEKTLDRTSDLYYQKLLIRFLNNDSSLTRAETLALMIGFTENPHYKPLEDMEKEQEIYTHTKNGEYEEALEKSKIYLQTHPLSLLINRERSFAYHQTGKKDSAKYFMDLNDKIMEAMIYSGKGKKPDAPIFSLGLADGEYFIPNVGYGIEKKDTEWNKHGDFMEVIQAVNEEAVKMNFYFVIQHAKQKIDDDKANDMANKKPKKPGKKKGKADKEQKPVTDSLPPAPVTDSIPAAPGK